MKKNNIVKLFVVAGLLQSCAGSVKYQGTSSASLVEGSEKLNVSSKICPHGMGLIRLYNDTTKGGITEYNSKMAYVSSPIKDDFNIYNLLKENNAQTVSKEELKKSKAEIDTSINSVRIRVNKEAVEESKNMNDGTSVLKSTGKTIAVGQSLILEYNAKNKLYQGFGDVESAVLYDDGAEGKEVLKSLGVNLGKGFTNKNLPETIENEELKGVFNTKYKAEIGKPLVININPKEDNGKETLDYVQITTEKDGKAGVTYNYIRKETPGDTKIEVPTKGIAEGDYRLYVFRSELNVVNAGSEAESSQNFCLEIGTGFKGNVNVAKPAPAKK